MNFLKKIKDQMLKSPIFYFILIYIGTIIQNAITSNDFMKNLIKYLTFPFAMAVQTEHELVQALYLGVILLVYYVTLKSIYNFFSEKRVNVKHHAIFEEELTKAILKIESNPNTNEIQNINAVQTMMKEYENVIKQLFCLEDSEIHCLWVFPKNGKSWMKISNKDLTNQERLLVNYVLDKDKSRMKIEDATQFVEDSNLKQVVSVRNCGKFKLGFYVLIYKEKILNEANVQEFNVTSSYLLLMGFHNKLIQYMKKVS